MTGAFLRRIGAAIANPALMLALILSAGQAVAERITQEYEVFIGGIRGATAVFDGEARDGIYRIETRVEGAGVLSYISGGWYSASVIGEMDGDAAFVPSRFNQRSYFLRRERKVDMQFIDGTPVSVDFTPERDADESPLPPLEDQAGTLDPLSSVLALTWPGKVRDICSRRIESFSGSRRTLVELSEPRRIGNGAHECAAHYSRIRGFDDATMKKQKRFPFTVTLRKRPDGLHEVWRISGRTDVGTMIIRRSN